MLGRRRAEEGVGRRREHKLEVILAAGAALVQQPRVAHARHLDVAAVEAHHNHVAVAPLLRPHRHLEPRVRHQHARDARDAAERAARRRHREEGRRRRRRRRRCGRATPDGGGGGGGGGGAGHGSWQTMRGACAVGGPNWNEKVACGSCSHSSRWAPNSSVPCGTQCGFGFSKPRINCAVVWPSAPGMNCSKSAFSARSAHVAPNGKSRARCVRRPRWRTTPPPASPCSSGSSPRARAGGRGESRRAARGMGSAMATASRPTVSYTSRRRKFEIANVLLAAIVCRARWSAPARVYSAFQHVALGSDRRQRRRRPDARAHAVA